MIRYTQGNLLDAPAEALVNTVNEVGVMGKGIALMFKERFASNTAVYERACRDGEVRVGEMLVTPTNSLMNPKWIINFPTKKHWRNPSKLEWIREGLASLVEAVRSHGIKSVALPPLGCGNGGLDWAMVRLEIEKSLAQLPDVEVIVFAPTSEYQNAPKRSGVEQLTPARAMIAEIIRQYGLLGLECTNLEVQKLAWFLDQSLVLLGLPNPLGLKFAANKYGPYADSLRHLLNGLDGSYLHCEKRLADAGPFDLITFDSSKREHVQQYLSQDEMAVYRPALNAAESAIDGFQSPLGMELLATVDWLLTVGKCSPDLTAVRQGLSEWPGGKSAAKRKQRLFDERLLSLAIHRLNNFRRGMQEASAAKGIASA